jgi:hypothetical protein
MEQVNVIVENAGKNLSAYIDGAPIIVVGDTVKEIEKRMKEAIAFYLEDNPAPVELLTGEFEIRYNIEASVFINYYSNVFSKSALSRITGVNERQLWHYAAGVHKPRRNQLKKIEKGIRSLAEELKDIVLV